MRPPLRKRVDSPDFAAPVDARTEALQEKTALAKHLHNQGVNPVRWTEADPAPQSEQVTFQKTGIKPRGNQFEVAGKLYNWSDEVKATPAQAKAIGDAYVAERAGKDDAVTSAPKIEELVDIAAVPLKHPLGTPHKERPANDMSVADERAALIKHYAQSGVDPDKAYLGDPVDMKKQEQLKAQIEKTLPGDKSEISGLPGFYQGFDDGWIYQANEYTRANDDILATEGTAAPANENYHASANLAARQNTGPGASSDGSNPSQVDSAGLEKRFNENAMSRLGDAADQANAIVSAMERAQSGAKLTEADTTLLSRIQGAFAQVGIRFDPANANLDYLRQVAKAIRKSASGSAAAKTTVPFHQLVQGLNVQLAQALVGSTMEWGQLKYLGPSQAILAATRPSKKLSLALAAAGPVAAAYALGNTAPQIAKKLAEEDGSPNLFSPYADDPGALTSERAAAAPVMTSSAVILQKLTVAEVNEIDRIFSSQLSTFNRATPSPMSPTQKADMLTSGTVSEIELFGLPIYLTDPRGSVQTQERIDKLKKMVRDKLVECGMEESFEWGGKIDDEIARRAKERFVPQGENGVRGARRADLSFKINWFGRTYIIDINTVDVLKNGSMTKAERIAAEGLRLNRLLRLSINETLPNGEKLEEFEGKIGTVPKGKDMSDEEWDAAAKEWVDSFLDCDGPLEADVYLDPESKHPWPGKE